MALSIREQALQAVAALLSAEGTPAGSVFRSYLNQIGPDQMPAYDISPGPAKVEDPGPCGDHGSVTRTLDIIVRAVVDASQQEVSEEVQGNTPLLLNDSALDPFFVFAVQQLTGGTADLNGLVLNVEELGDATVFQPAGRDLLGLEMTFQVQYATKRGDPTQKG